MKIPNVIHYCWFGGNEKPKLFQKCIESWKKYCPDYQIIEWNEDNYDLSRAPSYVQQAYSVGKWAFVTDYVRLDVIFNEGGVYLDTDVELVKDIDSLLQYNGFFGFETDDSVATGLGFGGIAGLQIIKELMDDYNDCTFIKDDGNYDLTPCPQRNMAVFIQNGLIPNGKRQILSDNVIVLPQEYLCPIDYYTNQKHVTDNTLAIHWFSASWSDEESRRYRKKSARLARVIGRKNADVVLGITSCIRKEGFGRYVAKRVKKYCGRGREKEQL